MNEAELAVLKRLISEKTKWVVFSNEIAIVLLVIASILLIIAIAAIVKSNSTSRRLNMNIETVSNNIMENNNLIKESKGHYEKIESASITIENMEMKLQEAQEEITLLMKDIKTQAGSVRHETIEQRKNIEAAFDKFNSDFSNTIEKVTNVVVNELNKTAIVATEENNNTRKAIIQLFKDHMLEINKSLIKSIRLTSDLTFGKATDVIGMALRDDSERNVKIFVSALNDLSIKQQKITTQVFSMFKEIEKNDGVVLRFINEQELETTKALASLVSENIEKQKAREEINMILDEHGFNTVIKETEKIEKELISDEEAIKLFNEVNSETSWERV